jgi:hypothetical protein
MTVFRGIIVLLAPEQLSNVFGCGKPMRDFLRIQAFVFCCFLGRKKGTP